MTSAPSGTLRQSADAVGLLIGTAVRPSLFGEVAYSQTLSYEFNMIEPENDMKWSAVRRRQDAFDFSGGDAVVAFARAHSMKVRGHCLVWDHDHPAWLAASHFTPKQLSQLLQEHITTTMQHYARQVFAWDVVNEAMDETGQLRDSIWYNRPGIGLAGDGASYIEQAFRWAREADRSALLFYNEAEAEGLSRKSDAIYAMLRNFKNRGVPIDGVGLQMHVSQLDFDPMPLQANIARLTALGLQVHITELDVSLPLRSDRMPTSEDLQRQAEVYREVVLACLHNPGCTAIQTWGFTDKYSWIGSHSHNTRGAALLFDGSYRPKPAYDAILAQISAKARGGR